MNGPPPKRREPRAGGSQRESVKRASPDCTARSAADQPRPWRVVVIGVDRAGEWSRYSDRDEADQVVAQLRRHGLDARLHIDEPPEHRGDRRRFLVWALMLGIVKPERMTERIVAELDGEQTQ